MRLPFSSDLHALRPAFELFSRTLAEGPYDTGILAGYLLDDPDLLAPLVDRRTILVTHAPPTGILDGTKGRYHGTSTIRELVRERRPRWHLFGHVHSGRGRQGRYLNGCYPHSMDFFDIDDGKRRVARIADQAAVPDPRWS